MGSGDLGELPLVLDVEMRGNPDEVHNCLMEIERLFGKRPMIYTGQGIWNTLGNTPWATDYPLWIANYLIEGTVRWREELVETVSQKTPFLPTDWENTGWTFWQFTQRGHGPDFGLNWEKSKQIDLNVYSGTLGELSTWIGIPVSMATPTDDPWIIESLPPIGKKVRITVPALNIRDAPIVLEDNLKDIMNEGDQTTITNVLKDDNYIWCETGYRQWFAYKRRDGTQYAKVL
jgi:hypothetical protein